MSPEDVKGAPRTSACFLEMNVFNDLFSSGFNSSVISILSMTRRGGSVMFFDSTSNACCLRCRAEFDVVVEGARPVVANDPDVIGRIEQNACAAFVVAAPIFLRKALDPNAREAIAASTNAQCVVGFLLRRRRENDDSHWFCRSWCSGHLSFRKKPSIDKTLEADRNTETTLSRESPKWCRTISAAG